MKGKIISGIFNKKITKNQKRTSIIPSTKSIKEVLIVSDLFKPEYKSAANLVFENAKITIIAPENKQLPSDSNNYVAISPSDFGWNGSVKSDKLLNIWQIDFDIIIDFSENSAIFNYVQIKTKSGLIVGFHEKELNNKIHDIFVTKSSSLEEDFRLILNTIKLLRNE